MGIEFSIGHRGCVVFWKEKSASVGGTKLFKFSLTRLSPASLHENQVLYTHLNWVERKLRAALWNRYPARLLVRESRLSPPPPTHLRVIVAPIG